MKGSNTLFSSIKVGDSTLYDSFWHSNRGTCQQNRIIDRAQELASEVPAFFLANFSTCWAYQKLSFMRQ